MNMRRQLSSVGTALDGGRSAAALEGGKTLCGEDRVTCLLPFAAKGVAWHRTGVRDRAVTNTAYIIARPLRKALLALRRGKAVDGLCICGCAPTPQVKGRQG